MDDSGFLRDLARSAREEAAEEQRRWERWEHLTDGDLSPEEEAELRALAATSVEDEKAFEAFRPLGADFRARMAEEIGLLIGKDAASEEPVEPIVTVGRERLQEIPANEEPRPFIFSWWRMAFAAPGLAAVTVALYWMIPPALPKFTIADVRSSIEFLRGEEETPTPVLGVGADFSALARPAAKLSPRKIEPRCYIQTRSSKERKLRVVDCSVLERNSRTGAPKIGGHLPPDLPAGPATLWIVLAYPGHQPAPDFIEKLPSDKATQKRTWVAEPTPIEVRAP